VKIKRLKLQNWKGVVDREISFSDGVTLIEGPNEIGKSTIIEAVQMLFTTLDSSSKKNVKSIQPVGQDVGSHVEAELVSGNYHFIYGKTFNKDKQTYLHIIAPQAEQLTSRDAHDRAEQILNETVDMALWNALLVEQGKEVTGAHLADSRGLARALDKAAGSTSALIEDAALFTAAQAEFENYFTLKTEKPKFSDLESRLSEAGDLVDATRLALEATEADAADHERCQAEIRRLISVIPELREKVTAHDAEWKVIDRLQDNHAAKAAETDAARQLLEASEKARDLRVDLVREVAKGLTEQANKQTEIEPLVKHAKMLKKRRKSAATEFEAARNALKQMRDELDLAKEDRRYLEQNKALGNTRQRLEQLAGFKKQASTARSKIRKIQIDAVGVDLLRTAERQVQITTAKREAIATGIELEAHVDLKLLWEGDKLELAAGKVEHRSVASETVLDILDVARIQVSPSQSAMDVEAELEANQNNLSNLLEKYQVSSLAEGVAAARSRADAERDLKALNASMRELLGDDSEEDIAALENSLQETCSAYVADREAETDIPDTLGQAEKRLEEIDGQFRRAEKQLEQERDNFNELNDSFNEANADLRVQTQEIEGLEKDLKRRQGKLEELRVSDSDEALEARFVDHQSSVERLNAELVELDEQIQQAMPDTVELLLTNSRDVLERAEKDLNDQRTYLAVVEDRLTKAQANGRFEELEKAELAREELRSSFESTQNRAEASKLLWKTLNKHRDSTRQAYLKPLKNQIEGLGQVVFGPGFTVEVDEDWSLLSRTLDGKTIPFDDLSVGAKEQLGILTRLAAARIVSSEGGVPLIIDDALGFSDPARLEAMGAAISSAGKYCQIILLTCTPGRFQNVGSAEVVRFETQSADAA
jgi:DNA repair exonuclease SbcCD ATPase subunit